MRAVPTAQVNDGFFRRGHDPASAALEHRLFDGDLRAGMVRRTPFVQRAASARILCPGMTVNLDGELIDCDEAAFELLAAALPVRVPGLSPRA